MGVPRRTLLPSASPLHLFGAELRRLRDEQGLSQADLGHASLVSEDLVRRIENADRYPTWDFLKRCENVLHCNGYLQRIWPMVARQRALVQARGSAPFRPELCDRPVLDWLISESTPGGIEPTDTSLDNELVQLRQLDHAHGAGSHYGHVMGALPRVRTASLRASIGFLELAGYEAVDLGADGSAQEHYLKALATSTLAGDKLHGGYLVAVSLAHLSLHCGDPEQAARLALAAMKGTATVSTPATRSAFLVVLARARARSGDEPGTTSALLAAERELGRSRAGEEPAFISYFSQADLADEKAHAFFDLGNFRLAQEEAAQAIKSVGASRVRRLAIDNALLASAFARDGELERACAAGRQAVDLAAGIMSFRSQHRVLEMLGYLHPNIGVPAVRDLFEYTYETLPLNTSWLMSAS
ncbi:helix-turn-helix domain-containing protein [Catelliglobosispora koreensis]|uniref:helix-turn-helix domain-containing protein n=1 Tax=Catelliglobosispora koreensis TaxID=129052 RepID=UPI00039BA325|nr:helix-turn-helix transcriptional regulator [Catelliglobosispora koreensis]